MGKTGFLHSVQGGAMNPTTMPTTTHYEDAYGLEMDRAIAAEVASLSPIARLNSSAIDIYKSIFWFAPAFDEWMNTAAQAITLCMELQSNCLMLFAQASRLPGVFWSGVAQPDSGEQEQPSAEQLARSMDIAIGERYSAADEVVEIHVEAPPQPETESWESEEEFIAFRARAA
jgi:hypothetical protein